MGSYHDAQSTRRRDLLGSLRATRAIFTDAGDYARSVKMELGIQMLLDHRVTERMFDLLEQSAAVAARDAADVATVTGRS